MIPSDPVPAEFPEEAHALWAETIALVKAQKREPDRFLVRAMEAAWLLAQKARLIIERDGVDATGLGSIEHPAVRTLVAAQDRFLKLRRAVGSAGGKWRSDPGTQALIASRELEAGRLTN